MGTAVQAAERAYTDGPVWKVSMLDVKPGQFDAYMAYLNGQWKTARQLSQKHGQELDYKIFAVEDARDNEPNLLLMVEFKNHAAFDRTADEMDALNKAVETQIGHPMATTQEREAYRKQMGSFTAQEVLFKK